MSNSFRYSSKTCVFVTLICLLTSAAFGQTKRASAKTPTPQRAAQGSELQKIVIPNLPEFHPQEPQRIVLPNGMIVFLQVDHEIPVISATARIRGGSRAEPAEKAGMVSIYGETWRTGGSKSRTGDQLDDFLEAHAAKIETDDAADSTFISFSCLKQDFEDVFSAYLELMNEPAFREDKIALAKRQMDGLITRRNDDVDSIAGREAVKLAYGPNSPYSRVPEYATVAAITRDDLVSWHSRTVHPNNIIFGITGDFDPKVMETRLRTAFGSLERGSPFQEPKIEFAAAKPALYFVPKEDVDQSNIQMVGLGIQRNNPDFYAVQVMNEILGGGFSSRLFMVIRSQLGLAYSVGGGVGSAWDHPGLQNFSLATKSATTAQSINALKKELSNFVTNPPTAAEMKRAKDSILNSFIFNFDSKEKVLAESMRYEFYGYPADYLERYRAGIDKTTVEDVNRVASKYLHPEALANLVVGNPGELGDQLTKLGPVVPVDVSIPAPPGQTPSGSGTSAGASR